MPVPWILWEQNPPDFFGSFPVKKATHIAWETRYIGWISGLSAVVVGTLGYGKKTHPGSP